MVKVLRPISPYAADAAVTLGQLIHKTRVGRRLTTESVAERAGISRGLLRRIEAGDPGCAIGSVFEVATVVGVPLFGAGRDTLAAAVRTNHEIRMLLPGSVRTPRAKSVDDDF